jgi:hypothetical protein
VHHLTLLNKTRKKNYLTQHILFNLSHNMVLTHQVHVMKNGTNGFPLKNPPDSYIGTNEEWRHLSQSQRRRVRKGPAIREKERAYRARSDVKADIKEYRKRPEVKAAAAASYLRCKQKKKEQDAVQSAIGGQSSDEATNPDVTYAGVLLMETASTEVSGVFELGV